MNTTYELNNLRKDVDAFSGKFGKQSAIVEIFSAMVNGEDLSKFGVKADKAVAYVKDLGARADNGDYGAIAELNTLRRFVVEAPIMQELNLLSIFGSYQNVGYDESIEREVWSDAGEHSREQAAGGDVVFPVLTKEVYPVPTFTVSGGYAVDYRRVSMGDMSKENEGLNRVKTDILNRAVAAIAERIYNAIKNATGVKYAAENAGLTKTAVDKVIADVRRHGKPTIVGDYALLAQFSNFAGYSSSASGAAITAMSQKLLDEIAARGILSTYNGAILSEMPNPYDLYAMNDAGDNFKTMLPAGLGFVIPTGVNSPVATFSRGGLTSFTGNNVKTGKVETRFDIEVGVDVAKGREHQIGILMDTNLGSF